MHPLNQHAELKAPKELPAEIGYTISQSPEREKKALHDAFELVHKARQAGAEMRKWAQRADVDSRALLVKIKKMAGQSVEARVWELSCWENKITISLRQYMDQTSEFINGLKPLNPPLRSDQIKPFLEAILSDRRVTIGAMEALTKTIAEMTTYKLDIHNRPPNPLFGYHPSH